MQLTVACELEMFYKIYTISKVNQSSEFACNFGSQVTYLLGRYYMSILEMIAFPGVCHHTLQLSTNMKEDYYQRISHQ